MTKEDLSNYSKEKAITRINNTTDSNNQLLPKYVSNSTVTSSVFQKANHSLSCFEKTARKRSSWNLKYSSIEELESAIDDFFDFTLENEMYPTIELLCVWLDMTRETLNRIENNHNDFRRDTIKKAKEKIIAILTQHLLAKPGNPAGNIFHLKALFGLTETSNIVINSSKDDPTKPKNEQEILDALPECPTPLYSSDYEIA